MKTTFTAANTSEGIFTLIRDTTAFLSGQGSPARTMFIAELVLEEILTNMIKYGYDDTVAHQIEVIADVSNGQITLEFRDDGHPFDPLSAPPPKFGEPAKTQRMGGRGLYLVRTKVKESHYRREDGWNILTLGFPVKPG